MVGPTASIVECKSLEQVAAQIPDGVIPNFPQKLLFDTFVDPHGPAMILIAHFYFTANLRDNERDPTEQCKWLRMHCPYISLTAKSIQQIRNKLAHAAFLEGRLFKKFVSNLANLHDKKTQAYTLVLLLISRVEEILEEILRQPINVPLVEEKKEEVEEDKMWTMSPSREIKTLNSGQIYRLLDIGRNVDLRGQLKGRTLLLLEGNEDRIDKTVIFRSWSGTMCYVSRVDDGERLSIRTNTLVVVLD